MEIISCITCKFNQTCKQQSLKGCKMGINEFSEKHSKIEDAQNPIYNLNKTLSTLDKLKLLCQRFDVELNYIRGKFWLRINYGGNEYFNEDFDALINSAYIDLV